MSFAPMMVGIILVRLVLAAASSRAGQLKEPSPITPRSRALVRLGVVWLLFFPSAGWLALSEPRTFATSVPGLAFLVTVLLWPFALSVLVPLGFSRAAYYVAFASWSADEDRKGRGLIAASLALHRQSDFNADDAAWIEEKAQAGSPLRGGAIVAAAAVTAARGDRDGARILFDSIHTLDPRACSKVARRVAAEWLAADAAARGDWNEVIAVGLHFAGTGRSARLLEGIAKRLLGQPDAPGRARLVFLWLAAPRRRHTFAIVERALSVPDGAAPPDDEADAPPVPAAPEGDLLASALALHTQLLSMKKPAPRDVARVGRAFDAVFDEDALPTQITERGAFLGAMRAEVVLGRFRNEVEDALFQLLKEHRIALDDTADELGEVAARAQRRLRDETLTVIEALSDAVRNRVREHRELLAIDEWREWTALRMAYDRGVLLGGPELRYLAFTKVHVDVCALAVWLFNDRKERPLANAMFQFLLDEAKAVGDAEGITLQTKNVACGI